MQQLEYEFSCKLNLIGFFMAKQIKLKIQMRKIFVKFLYKETKNRKNKKKHVVLKDINPSELKTV